MLMNRKKMFALLLALVMVLSLAACGGKPAGQAQSNGAKKDSVVIAFHDEPTTLDPTQGWGHGNTPLIQSTLVKYDYDMSFRNDLATEYTISEDALVWTFKLREDAFFTDGEKVTASDVVFTFETAKAAASSIDLTFVEKLEAPDDTTFVITLSKPNSTFLNTVASVGIVPEHAYGEDYGTNPVGSGPWKLAEWKVQEQLILEANEDYYGDVPSIKKVVIAFMDEDAAFAAVKAGQVDVALTSATLATAQFPGYRLEVVSSVDNRGFTLPLTPNEGRVNENGHPIGNDVTCNKEIRQAMAYALDRELLAEIALNGFATPCYSENDGMPWNNPEVKVETDLEYAKKLLSDAGWADTDGDGIVERDGLKAEFTALYPSYDSARQSLGLAAAELLLEVGIKINLEGTSWDDIDARQFSNAVVMGWGAANPGETYFLYHSAGALKNDYYNPEGMMSPVVDAHLDAAMESLTVEEAYKNWQLAQWDGETGTAMKGECPWVWMVNIEHLYYVREGLDIGAQQLHPHGACWPLVQNLDRWIWSD